MRDYLTDGRISLRKYRMGDEFSLYEAIQESIVELTHRGFYHVGFTMEDAVNDVVSRITTWTEGGAYTFLIEERPGPVFLGNCKIEELELERNHAALGWWVRTSKTGHGIATAAASLMAQAAFEDLPLNSLSIYTNADNIASRHVAEKIGAVLVQIKPEDDGRYCAVYELKPEYLLSIETL
jgi:ribosomal-protein-serine acetyltransferase